MIKVGILGAAGYTGGELIRLLLNHPEAEIVFANSESNAGNLVSDVHEGLIGETDLKFTDEMPFDQVDVVFFCFGHGKSEAFLKEHTIPENVKIIDLAQDFRIKGDHDYVYGLPEINKEEILQAQHVANPGCFATCIQVALLPAAYLNLLKDDVAVNAITGSTGAGQKPGATTHFSWRNNNLSIYKPFQHQHIAEIRQSLKQVQGYLDADIDFIPYRGDFARGIFCTAVVKTPAPVEDVIEAYQDFYRDAAFTHYSDKPLDLKQVVNTNKALVHVEKYGNKLLITSCIDNLLKGAVGQAVQNMNLMFGIDETAGLRLKALLLLLSTTIESKAVSDHNSAAVCQVQKIELEQLPDLNISRAGHQVFCINGEYVVAGGHTNGFVPTPTAEYFKDGQWHVIQMTYNHDFALSAKLKSGKILIAGGCEQPSGIGQTFNAELYDPETHSFRGFGILQRKRVWASALELDSGEVVITGNWYHNDGIEMFSEAQSVKGDHQYRQSFTYIRDVATQRTTPSIIRIAKDDALIFGPYGIRGDSLRTAYAYRLKGDSVHIPLFETWQPISIGSRQADASFIGDEAKGDFTSLVPVKDSTGQVAIARFSGTEASLLPTTCPVPMVCKGDSIVYFNITADRQRGRAYLFGLSKHYQTLQEDTYNYILIIDYAHASANGVPITLCYTEPLEMMPDFSPILTPEGDLLIAGGLDNGSNFTPSNKVYLLPFGGHPAAIGKTDNSLWLIVWLTSGAFLLSGALIFLYLYMRKRRAASQKEPELPQKEPSDEELMLRIRETMQSEKLFLNSNLKVADLATLLGTNSRYISRCINVCENRSFSDFVNDYRIEYAKQLMVKNPEMKVGNAGMPSN